jgi:hypothetical protein
MIKHDDQIYFSSISYNSYHDNIWNEIYNECDQGGKFFIDISKRINPCRFVTRNGEWSLPWNQKLIPGYEMPAYDPKFNKTFSEVTDELALKIRDRINLGEKFSVMYSGGIDSTVIVSALIKNLTEHELENISISASIQSVIENPVFYDKFIYNKFKIIDSNKNKYDDIIDQGFTPITADEGDCIFGTVFGLNFYNNFDYYISDFGSSRKSKLEKIRYKISDSDVHYSEYADPLIKYLGIQRNQEFGKLFYEKLVHNVNTSNVPIHSLHDFFWWLIFNIKYLNCAVRGSIYLNDRLETKFVMDKIVNWFSDDQYQKWSMVNNNNGQKIKKTLASYKQAAKDYIYDLDKNEWYKNFKIKLESLWVIGHQQDVSKLEHDKRPVCRVGLTKDYQLMYIDDPEVQDFFRMNLQNYKIDWT